MKKRSNQMMGFGKVIVCTFDEVYVEQLSNLEGAQCDTNITAIYHCNDIIHRTDNNLRPLSMISHSLV
jgi:hypothetical protein